MCRILITGVGGLLGSHLAKYLIEKGYEVIGVDDFSGGYEDFVPDGCKLIKHTLGSKKNEEIEREFKKGIDCVFHFAAYAALGLSPFIRDFNYRNNILGSVELINLCVNYNCKIVFASSMDVYGEKNVPPYTEEMEPSPIDPYGIAKHAIELDLEDAYRMFGLRYSIVRPHNVVGINQCIWDRYRNVVGIFIRKAINGEDLQIYGDGNQTRAFSDIKFYMEPFEKLIKSFDGEIFNIGADKYFSINEVAEMVDKVSREFGVKCNIVNMEPRHEVKHAYCNHDKAKKLLDFKDETNLEETIREMFIWAVNQPDREVKKKEYEINKNIYSYWK